MDYSTYLGGNGTDFGYAIAVDDWGNLDDPDEICAYVTGSTQEVSINPFNPTPNNFPVTVGAFDTITDGTKDVFVTKLFFTPNL